jgi:hypothetical protein
MENNTEETPLPDIKVRENTEKSINEASVLFFQSMKKIRGSKLSRKQFIRAFDFAMNNTLTDRKVVLQSDTERQMAFLLGLVFDARLIMISKLYEDKQITNNKENEENEPNPQVS